MKHSTVLKAAHSHHWVAAVQPHAANQGEFGISPVQTLVKVVHGQTWRELDSYRKSWTNRRPIPGCVLPVGHWMFSSTTVSLMVPSIAAVSILGWFPQSAQYILLMNRAEDHCFHHCYLYWAPCFLPAHSPSLWVDHDGVRLVDHAGDERLSVMFSAELGHLDDVSTGIGPVQVSCHPVHCDPTRHLQIRNLKK